MRGKFITFEGGEGGGKSTQAARMAGYLRGKGLEVLETREPGGTPKAKPCAICWCRAIPTVGRRCLNYC